MADQHAKVKINKTKGRRMNNTATTTAHNPKNETTISVIQITEIVELGKATSLTLGGSGNRNEYARPNAKYQGF
jgi:hypothetical protein